MLAPALAHPGAATLNYLYPPKDAAVRKSNSPWGVEKVYPVTFWVVVDLATVRCALCWPSLAPDQIRR